MRTHDKRLLAVEKAIGAMPIPGHVARDTYLHFQATGELPDGLRVAGEVIRHCKNGMGDSGWDQMDFAAQLRHLLHLPERPDDEVMNRLYDEAVYGCETVRTAARDVLMIFSDLGLDVTEPLFANRGLEPPDWDGVGLWFFGFPHSLAIPPYEEQAHRLFDRYTALRERVPQGNRRWFDALASAVGLFQLRGELPRDGLMRECALADGELLCLVRHSLGHEVAELMAALDAVARAEGEEREVSIGMVSELAGDGRLRAAEA